MEDELVDAALGSTVSKSINTEVSSRVASCIQLYIYTPRRRAPTLGLIRTPALRQ
jgi:hypothetical protein